MTPRERLALLLFAASAAALAAAASLHVDLLVDDLQLAAWGLAADWRDVVLLRHSPFPFHVLLWKLAAHVFPADPQRVVHVVAALLHGVNVWLVHRLLRAHFATLAAWLGTAAFAFFRPGNESVLWASAEAEILMTCFALLSLLLWQRGRTEPAWRWVALVGVILAVLAKTSACLLVVVLAAHALWVEAQGRWRRLPPGLLAPLAAGALLSAGLVALALAHDGHWSLAEHYLAGRPPLATVFANYGSGLARLATLVAPERFLPASLTGAVALAVAAALLVRGDPRLRFGVLLAGALLAPSVFASGLPESRYLYGPAVGAVFAGCVLFERAARTRAGRRAAVAAAGVWITAGSALYAGDVARYAGCGRAAGELRALLAEHRDELRGAAALAVVSPMRLARPADILGYDHGLETPVRPAETCTDDAPCVAYRRPVAAARTCPAAGEFPFVRFESTQSPLADG